ncbi:CRISPR-associated endoribonuclease Cas6 [Cytophagaceae bacterium DM2B3-1]|uniref:CRISPR-associated endoribonuclease Cas6 n=1 Tax=Xanthocytophaga flava TaxID=3048013 RepID=A0ABT7CT46_9BACT|nr:CRISPR-associated endoribonuclease Cas6 [Xanthocytophaga flavus]MDJ1496936.1 CRISPR-associated endoribonuclease Cas6 [Xanthocytophaga flavus]
MRLHLSLSKNTEPVPFNYQPYLVGCLHKWIGENDVHDQVSLYSFSWLKNSRTKAKGLDFPQGGNWFISSYDTNLLKSIVTGIQQSPDINFGLKVKAITIQEDPDFRGATFFKVASPIFIKRNSKFYFYSDIEADNLLTETLQTKLKKANLPTEGIKVSFDKNYANPAIKAITYNGILNKASLCPIIVEGTPEQVAFAWNVGIGNSTGIGFGALI